MKNIKWKTVLALAVVYTAVVMQWHWVWGILFIMWTVPALYTGHTHLVEDIERKRNPILFWLIVATWIGLSLWLIVGPLLPGKLPPAPSGTTPAHAAPAQIEPPEDEVPVKVGQVEVDAPAAPAQTLGGSAELPQFETRDAPGMTVVGLATTTRWGGEQYVGDIQELWAAFESSDLSRRISNIVDNRVYVVYSDQDQRRETFTVTIGLRTSGAENGPAELHTVKVPPTRFAVFEPQWRGDDTLDRVWRQIWDSDLPAANTYDLEIYSLDPSTYAVQTAQIWVAVDQRGS